MKIIKWLISKFTSHHHQWTFDDAVIDILENTHHVNNSCVKAHVIGNELRTLYGIDWREQRIRRHLYRMEKSGLIRKNNKFSGPNSTAWELP